MEVDKYIISEMLMAFSDGRDGMKHENYAFGECEENGMRNVLALIIGKGWRRPLSNFPSFCNDADAKKFFAINKRFDVEFGDEVNVESAALEVSLAKVGQKLNAAELIEIGAAFANEWGLKIK